MSPRLTFLTCTLTLILTAIPALARELDATPFLDPARGDMGIQNAIDALGPEGGTVILPAGKFVLERYLYLRSNVTLRGQGETTILALGEPEQTRLLSADVSGGATEIPLVGDLTGLKPGTIVHLWRSGPGTHSVHIRSVRAVEVRDQTLVIDQPVPFQLRPANNSHVAWGMTTALAAPAVAGERTIRVEHPQLLRPNQGLTFSGKGDMWDHHFNAIVAVQGDVLTLERPLTVSADAGTEVRLAHSIITADGEKNIAVENLVIQGFQTPRKPRSTGFHMAGVHFVRCENVTLRHVEIRDWHGDAFSIQAGRYATVEHCTARHSGGHGFHPGTGLNDAEFTHLHSEHNGGDGLYYCWHNQRVNVRHSTFLDNGAHGIGGLGIPGDHHNIVEHNRIERNGRSGIEMTGGNDSHNVVRHNVIRDNSQRKAGEWPGILITATWSNWAGKATVEANTIESTLAEPTQWVGIEERHAEARNADHPRAQAGRFLADHNRIAGNTVTGHRTADIIIRGANTVIEGNTGKVVEERFTPDTQ